tara:strand:+ start:403 stop:594 length:192 start_codon:yes stop_codon:yes gene_type:complete
MKIIVGHMYFNDKILIIKKYAIVLGAGGFIGGHLAKQLKSEGFWVRGADLKKNNLYNQWAVFL